MIISQDIRTARKRHTCDNCNGAINKKEQYLRLCGKADAGDKRPMVLKYCDACGIEHQKSQCDHCEGKGRVWQEIEPNEEYRRQECFFCSGTGKESEK